MEQSSLATLTKVQVLEKATKENPVVVVAPHKIVFQNGLTYYALRIGSDHWRQAHNV